jgi:hypothetical protein
MLAEMVFKNRALSEIIDAGIVSGDTELNFVKSKSVRIDADGIGMVDTQIPPVARMPMTEQSRYKYIIHVDGNVQAYRLLTTMRTGSMILRVKGAYTSWLDGMLKEGVHYVGIDSDLSNLEERVRWCLRNDAKCRRIAANSLKLALQVSSREYLEAAMRKTIVMTSIRQTGEIGENGQTGNQCRPLIRGKRRRPQLVQRFYETRKTPYKASELSAPIKETKKTRNKRGDELKLIQEAIPVAAEVPQIQEQQQQQPLPVTESKKATRSRKSKNEIAEEPDLNAVGEDGMPLFVLKTGARCPTYYEKYGPDPRYCKRNKTVKKK